MLVDAAAIFVSLAPDEVLDFPEALRLELETAGQALASAAVQARVDIVTDVIGASLHAMTELIDSLRSVGYTVDVVYVHADFNQAWQWSAIGKQHLCLLCRRVQHPMVSPGGPSRGAGRRIGCPLR